MRIIARFIDFSFPTIKGIQPSYKRLSREKRRVEAEQAAEHDFNREIAYRRVMNQP